MFTVQEPDFFFERGVPKGSFSSLLPFSEEEKCGLAFMPHFVEEEEEDGQERVMPSLHSSTG